MFTEFDRLAMTRALALAERGLETTHPNPRVGCVLAKGDRIIGEGWHERAGEPHAEIMALRSAKEPVAGATAYVTLEPCSHHGRTPPCANALIEARIARVVFAVQDPNPRVSGQGADALLRAGITVEAGLMQNEATELNIGFMKRMKEGLPWVRVKLAMSLDGRTALANGASQWITGEPARADVQRWRARCSAVMTGVGTVLADDPLLNVRLQGFKGRQPLRVVLDARLRSPPGAKMFASLAGVASGAVVVGGPVLIFAAADGGFAATAGVGRGAVISDPSTLSDDMAELVSAFETSPTAVSARTDTVAGPVSVKAEPRTSSPAQAAASSKAATTAPVTRAPAAGAVAAGAAAPSKAPVASPTGSANSAAPAAASPASTSSATQAPSLAATSAAAQGTASTLAAVGGAPSAAAAVPPMGGAAAPGAAANDVTGVSPPVLAAAGDAAGVAPTSDDATWAGAALSGAVPVKRETATPPNGTTPPANPAAPLDAATAGIPAATLNATAAVSGANGTIAPPAGTTAVANSTTPSASATTGPAPAAVSPANATAGASSNASAHGASTNAAIGSAGASPQPVLPKSVVAPVVTVESPQNAAPMQSAATGQGGAAQNQAAPAHGAAPVRDAAPAPNAASTQAAASRQGQAPTQTNAPAKPAAAKTDSPAAFQARKAALVGKGVRIEEVPADEGFLDLFAVLKKLGDMEVNEVLVEAGPTLAGQLLTTFFVDELLLYVAPKLLGPQGRPLVNLPELQSLQDAWGFSLFDAKRFGDDLRLRMRPK